QFCLLRDWVRLERNARTACADDIEFVACTREDAWHEQLPDARAVAQTHWMAARVPGIEIANHRDPSGIRRPHREPRAAYAVNGHHIVAEYSGQLEMPPLAEQVEI